MGVFAGPDLKEDGLVLCLDAGSLKSYDKYENLVLDTSSIGLTPTYAAGSGGGIIGLNTTATTDPNGTNQASTLDNNGSLSQGYVYSGAPVGLTTNTTYTYSIHIKQGTKPDFQITIDENGFSGKRYYASFTYSNESVTTGVTGAANDGVVVGSTATKLTNSWYRLSLTFKTSTTNVNTFVDMINRFGNTSGSNYVWGRQLEIGNTTTDYYATTSTAKTRGTTLTDLTGRSNTGTLLNGPTFSNSNGGSIVFSGTTDRCQLSNNSDTQFPHDSPWSFSLVYKIVSSVNTYPGIITKGSGAGSGILIFYYVPDNTVLWKHNNVQTSFTTVDIGTIKHITFTYSGSGNVNCYVNGSLYGSAGTMASTDSSSVLRLGVGDEYGNVQIYNFVKYNRALTASEVQQNFNTTRGRFGI
jgi:hypothetical protein